MPRIRAVVEDEGVDAVVPLALGAASLPFQAEHIVGEHGVQIAVRRGYVVQSWTNTDRTP